MKKFVIGGGLSICLFLGVLLFNYEVIEQERGLTKEDLYESENQSGYPMSNLGVSISGGRIMNETEQLEFVVENKSTKEWYWRRNLGFDEKDGEDKETDLEIEIDGIWYYVPLEENRTNWISPAMQWSLFPGRTTIISVGTGIYQVISPGNYRFTVAVYDDDLNEFYLSCEFVIAKERQNDKKILQ